MPELTTTSPFVNSNTFTMGLGNPMPESTLTPDASVDFIAQSGTRNLASLSGPEMETNNVTM
jgi:hypothetical protein